MPIAEPAQTREACAHNAECLAERVSQLEEELEREQAARRLAEAWSAESERLRAAAEEAAAVEHNAAAVARRSLVAATGEATAARAAAATTEAARAAAEAAAATAVDREQAARREAAAARRSEAAAIREAADARRREAAARAQAAARADRADKATRKARETKKTIVKLRAEAPPKSRKPFADLRPQQKQRRLAAAKAHVARELADQYEIVERRPPSLSAADANGLRRALHLRDRAYTAFAKATSGLPTIDAVREHERQVIARCGRIIETRRGDVDFFDFGRPRQVGARRALRLRDRCSCLRSTSTGCAAPTGVASCARRSISS